MQTVGLYIASVTSLGSGKYKLNDCWVESSYSEIALGDIVTDKNGNVYNITYYEGYPQRAQENLWIEVEWPDYPNTDVPPVDNSDTMDYSSTIGSLEANDFAPEIAYRCRIASSANSYPAYHYAVVLTDANLNDPGATQGDVGDYLMDSSGQIFEVVEWNGWEQVLRVRDIEERPHATDGSSRPIPYEYAQFYRPTVDASVLPQGDISILGDDAQDDAIAFSNTEIWRHRGVQISKDATILDNVTKITIGDGLGWIETGAGWGGGKSIELETNVNITGSFTSASRQTFTAAAGQTMFAVEYEIGFIDVYMNGFKLVIGSDFTAATGSMITILDPCSAGDIIDVIAYDTFSIANHYTVSQIDSSFVPTIGDTTIDGELTANAFNIASARIYKENIADWNEDAISILNSVDVVAFNYISDPTKLQRIGFIADDTDEIMSGPEQSYFDMSNTVGILLKAVQQLSAKVKELEEKDGK